MPCFLCSGRGIVDSTVASDSSHQQLLLNILLFVEKTRMALFLKKQLRIYWFSMAENFIILPAANPEMKPYVRCQFSITKIVRYKSTKNAKRIFLGAKSVRICFNARAWIYQKLEIESVFILISSHFRALLSA